MPGKVKSLTSYFSVPKGDTGVRTVYDATRSNLNASLWAPNFGLPTVESVVRGVNEESWMGDLDIGEMFLNFSLHPKLQPFCGVDLRPYFGEEVSDGKTLWERWVRCMMGMKNSPYVCIKGLLLALEFIRGDHKDPNNPFHWDDIKLNLPGQQNYDPSKPRLQRLKNAADSLAALIISYVDDMRAAGSSAEECWHVMHTVATRATYLGIQVAARKTRPPSKNPGPWAGSMIVSDANGVAVRATQEKWDKTKDQIRQTLAWVESGQPIDRKALESIRGSLVYLQRTYPAITPYVKGYHLTIDSWRPNRDEEGWRVELRSTSSEVLKPPEHVKPVPRFRNDLLALTTLFEPETPPLRYVRSNRIVTAKYGFADASGAGFGSTMSTEDGGLHYTHGVWPEEDWSSSSNFRELNNLVQVLENGYHSGQLLHTEVWLFTDNSASEGVFYKGHSPSPRLNDLALRLRRLEMWGTMKIQLVHIAGTRMVSQGTDGLSRGDVTEGVMAGSDMLSYVPLRYTALERQPGLVTWVQSWLPAPALCCLSVADWFSIGHGVEDWVVGPSGFSTPVESPPQWYLWSPAPALADVMLDELEESRHKRKTHNHVVLLPRLMTFAWRKRLQKICDFVFELPPGKRDIWPADEHEPLIIGLTLRFSSSRPWQVKRATNLLDLERCVREVWSHPHGNERSILHEFCLSPERLDGLSAGLVRHMLHSAHGTHLSPEPSPG